MDYSNNHETASEIKLQQDRKIVVAGSTCGGFCSMFVARVDSTGAFDNSFDSDGKRNVIFQLNFSSPATGLWIQPDGKILLSGYATVVGSSNEDFALARLVNNGALDPTFDTDGKLNTTVLTSNDRSYAMLLQPDGKIVVGGYAQASSGIDCAIIRYLNNMTTGIDEASNDNSISIYPNPVEDKIFVNSSKFNFNEIKIIDVLGNEVMRINFKHAVSQCQLLTAELKSGIYFLQLFSGNNKQIQKFVKD